MSVAPCSCDKWNCLHIMPNPTFVVVVFWSRGAKSSSSLFPTVENHVSNTFMYIPNLFELVFPAQPERERRWTLGRRGKVDTDQGKLGVVLEFNRWPGWKDWYPGQWQWRPTPFSMGFKVEVAVSHLVWLGTRYRAMETDWGWAVQAGAGCRVEAFSPSAVPALAASWEWRHWWAGWSSRR